ncbi:hypothetical protein CLV59_109162 [Chitinophaga dinghuensis]|uniref:Uncharacterized protein n=1 Tax=Chitinophaga dinghuensis TaxID=1539050 RepID=A0A327VPS3_9BACT|nr:hypothetical protein [Chitinophaga dinghuensis]RAJ75548.1 hypothetical protein CLV59_109162 [Chitinophaga dinghuensis]
MLTRLFVSLLLMSSIASAQNNIVANRLLVKDSLSLNGKWIRQINNDSTLQNASNNSISTDAALKKYIDKSMLGGGSISPGDVAKMVTGPSVLEVAVRFWTGDRMTPLINFNLNFLSSDGIKSTYYVSGAHPYEVFCVYGKPPFSLYATINNKTSDSVLSIHVSTAETTTDNYYRSYDNSMFIKPGDTAFITADRLRGYLTIGIESWLRTYPENQIYYVNEKIKNHSATQTITIQKENYGPVVLMPGQEVSQRNIWLEQAGYKGIYLLAGSIYTATNGQYMMSNRITAPVRYTVYRNGELYLTKDFLDYMNSWYFEIDPTWEDYEIILEDIQP